MIAPFEAAQKPAEATFRKRLQGLSGVPWCGEGDSITGTGIASLTSGDLARGDKPAPPHHGNAQGILENSKGLGTNQYTVLHLIFRPSLPPLQSQNPQRSPATPAVLLNQERQI
jgi:hypothetical protein